MKPQLLRDDRGRLGLVGFESAPLVLDFAEPYWRSRPGTEFLPRAFRGLAGTPILDATAGWGRDAWLLAYRGFQVTMCERHPLLFALLEDALTRARQDSELAPVAARLQLEFGDVRQRSEPVPAVYLDPMFPERDRRAKSKKYIAALQTLLGAEDDGEALLAHALEIARLRVVVKRPRAAPPLKGPPPTYAISSPKMRYDVYRTG